MWNLVAGGFDTATSLVSWGLHHLGTHPEDRDRLVADPSGIPMAIEEFLRHCSPSETLPRTATRDVELGGRQIRRGDVVFIGWVSANHDAAVADTIAHVLDRMPDYVVDEERFRPYPGNLLLTGVASMPVTFTPGARLG